MSDAAGRTGSSAWGWTDPKSGREFAGKFCTIKYVECLANSYAVSGMFEGTAFIEILKTGRMVELAFL